MTQPNTCPITGDPIQPGETISRTAARQLTTIVTDLPTLMADAEYALQGLHTGQQSGGGSSEGRLPINLNTLEDLDTIRDSLDIWAHSLAQWASPQLRYRPGDWTMIRAIIRQFANQARRWEEAPQLVDEVMHCMHLLERVASPARRTMVYAGPCPECGLDLLANPGDDTAQCRECGTVVDVQEQRDQMITKLAWRMDTRQRATRQAELVTGRPIPDSTVRKWIQRGRLQEHHQPAGGPPLVAVRDIVTLATQPRPAGRSA